MSKVDYKKELKELYNPSKENIVLIKVPKMNFLMIDGVGDPNTAPEYKNAIEALYAVAYKIKFSIKKTKEFDYVVPPLEGLWWTDNMADFSVDKKNDWKWTMMIMQPNIVTKSDVQEAIEIIKGKKNPVALPKLRFESYKEGVSAQIMYIGSYADEAPTIQKIHKFIEEQGKTLEGKHHEIYLSDPRRVASEKLKTVLRQPMR